MRLDSERLAEILEAEDSRRSRDRAFEPASDFDKLAPALAVFRVHVAQIASDSVLENGHHQLQLAFERVISPYQVGILRGHQDSPVRRLFHPRKLAVCVDL